MTKHGSSSISVLHRDHLYSRFMPIVGSSHHDSYNEANNPLSIKSFYGYEYPKTKSDIMNTRHPSVYTSHHYMYLPLQQLSSNTRCQSLNTADVVTNTEGYIVGTSLVDIQPKGCGRRGGEAITRAAHLLPESP